MLNYGAFDAHFGTFDDMTFDVEIFDPAPDVSSTWTASTTQAETWTPATIQSESWTVK